MIKILQINIRSIWANKNYLEAFLSINKVDVALLSETWLNKNKSITISGYSLIRADRNDGYGGSGILVKNNLQNFKVLDIPSKFNNKKIQTCGITLKFHNLKINLLSIYCAPKHKISIDSWDSLFRSTKHPLLIGGDFNSHHSSFGCTYDDNEGRYLLDAIHNHNLCILNDGSPTLLERPDRQPSAVDLTICSPNLIPLCEWYVSNEPLGSDHMGIIITINNGNPIKFQTINNYNKWNINRANWSLYTSTTDQLLSKFSVSSDPLSNYKNFVRVINEAAEKSIPQIKQYKGKKSVHPPKPWWDDECSAARDKNIYCYQQYKQTPSLASFIKCKQATAQCPRTYKIKKIQKWKEFCNSFSINTPVKEVWSKLKAFNRGHRKPNPDNYDWIPSFLNTLTPEIVPEHSCIPNIPISNHRLNDKFQYPELLHALKNSANTSPGIDNIHYPMLINLSTFSKNIILKIFNQIWINHTHIEEWNTQVVIPLLKPQKDPNDFRSYRPIALSSCMAKTFERLIKTRLEWWLESERMLPDTQSGFRKGHNTMDALSVFVTEVYKSFSDNQFLLAANVDLTNAYNNVSIPILLIKMASMGIPSRIIKHTYNLFYSRSITVRNNGNLTDVRRTYIGLPQGAVLSPLLFNIYTADVNAILGEDTKVSQFADDIVLYTQDINLEAAINNLSSSMNKFSEWCFNLGMSLSESKSSVTVFTRRRKYRLPSPVKLGNTYLRVEPVMKTLGVFIDNKLLWKAHIDHIIKKCEQFLNILRYICHSQYGADIKTALMIYRQLIRSRIDYGCFLYGNAAHTHLQRLNVVQFKAIQSCLGALRSAPTNALLVEAKEFPLHIRRKLLANRFLIDRLKYSKNLVISNLSAIAPRVWTEQFRLHKKTPILIPI